MEIALRASWAKLRVGAVEGKVQGDWAAVYLVSGVASDTAHD